MAGSGPAMTGSKRWVLDCLSPRCCISGRSPGRGLLTNNISPAGFTCCSGLGWLRSGGERTDNLQGLLDSGAVHVEVRAGAGAVGAHWAEADALVASPAGEFRSGHAELRGVEEH